MKSLSLFCLTLIILVGATSSGLADATKGQGVYMNFCASCHDGGLAGAPETGDKAVWKKRQAKGEDAVIANAINGYQGETGYMPARGGMSSLSDDEVASAVMYMLEQSK